MAVKIIRKWRWNKEFACIHCGCVDDIMKHSKLRNGIFRYFCSNCGKTFTDLTATIFEKSKIPLWKWLYALIILLEKTACLSAAELSRNLEISYPSAWKMLHKLRKLLRSNAQYQILSGIIESDEAWFTKKEGSQIVLGMVERDGRVQFYPIIDRKEDQLLYPHYWYVERGSIVMTDSHSSYGGLSSRFTHHWINHSTKQWKWRDVYTNTIEGVWGMIKGVIRTIHHGVSKKHLMSYLSLFAFKYNNRHHSIHQKLSLLMHLICQPRSCLY